MTTPVEPPARTVPTDVDALVRLMLTDPGRPRLTWYGPDAERVELSGAVLVNWTTKIANLLDEELDAGPGTHVLIDMPPHWQSILWAIGTWRRGACVTLDGARTQECPVDVVVTDRPEVHDSAADLVAVTLAPLARTFGEGLPAGAVDAAAAVMTYGDVVARPARPDGRAPAAAAPGVVLAYDDLLLDLPSRLPRARHLGVAGAGRLGLHDLKETLASLAADGSVVLMHPDRAASAAADPEVMARLVSSERITSADAPGKPSPHAPTP